MTPEEIRFLIRNGRIEDAVIEIIELTENLSSGLNITADLLQSRLTDCRNDETIGIDIVSELNQIKRDALSLLNKIVNYTGNNGQMQAETNDNLLIDCSLPFIDRAAFRNILRDSLQSRGAIMIFVRGTPKSGMSYLERYLLHLRKQNSIFKIIPIDIYKELNDPRPYKGVRLAKLIAAGIELEVDFNEEDEEQYKFMRLMYKLKEHIAAKTEIPIFFIHDFHRLEFVPLDINNLIFNIANSIYLNELPKSVFIVAGFNFELLHNWHTLIRHLKSSFPVYNMESINEDNIKDCLVSIFRKYQNNIIRFGNGRVTEEEYVDLMLEQLVTDRSNIDVVSVGLAISDHLDLLK